MIEENDMKRSGKLRLSDDALPFDERLHEFVSFWEEEIGLSTSVKELQTRLIAAQNALDALHDARTSTPESLKSIDAQTQITNAAANQWMKIKNLVAQPRTAEE